MIIEEGTYVKKAEQVMKDLQNAEIDNKKYKKSINVVRKITTSKLRNLLAMAADIYNEVLISDEKLADDLSSRIDYLRVRFVYEVGRDDKDEAVKIFVERTEILEALKEVRKSRKQYILFYHYMEALVAYHRYYGGRD